MSTPFASAAPYHARYRPPYPAEFYALLADRFALDGWQTVLDLGAGPGANSLALAPLVDHVYAVDPEPAMLAEGRRLAEDRGCANVSWLEGDASVVSRLCLPRIDLCVIGSAFRRMDRVRVLADLDAMLAPRGGIVLVSSADDPEGTRPSWTSVVEEVCANFLGADRRTEDGVAETDDPVRPGDLARLEDLASPEDLDEGLAKSAFSRIDTTVWNQRLRFTADQLVGLQLSFPRSSPALLGDRQGAFESALRQALLDHDPGGTYSRTVAVTATLATRPRP
ncbi:class I SAM-dependent methyltransferase [Streptomyces sp. NBC_01310]|uniref:class I SAM-dependent methyltransferase n=1 Tax=Streptomyces sp. NBC_01310 TaxID=2903820 RepID=UPI0035B67346|nr:class I SAM-dependent methyltransferase [Streptomyces sp. NBC_01310]